jgi:hypothetical protein
MMEDYDVQVLGLERHHYCRELLQKAEKDKVPVDRNEDMENKLTALFKITLEIAKKAVNKVFY